MIIRVRFSTTDQSFKTSFNATDQSITPAFEALQHVTEQKEADRYTGEYDVTPLVDKETTLPTANKIMTKDVVVKQVPYFETSNDSGGITVYIGKVE